MLLWVMTKKKLEEYFILYYPMVYRVAFAQVRNHADAEDISQETFMRLLRSEPEYRSAEHEKAWMIRTTLNLCKDLLKSKWKTTSVDMGGIPEWERAYFKVPYIEEDDTLWAVLRLPANYRNSLYLFYYEDYSIREIALCLGMQENTVKTNLRRGKQMLKDMLQRERSLQKHDSQ